MIGQAFLLLVAVNKLYNVLLRNSACYLRFPAPSATFCFPVNRTSARHLNSLPNASLFVGHPHLFLLTLLSIAVCSNLVSSARAVAHITAFVLLTVSSKASPRLAVGAFA
jgi:hypothetical protein